MSDTEVDLRDVLAGFDNMARVLDRHGRDLFAEVGRDIKADAREQKRERRGVGGESWAPRAPSTRERGKRGGKKRRSSASTGLLGKIPTAYKTTVDPGGVELVNQVPFAMAHHEGATVGHGAQLPARPHADLDPERVDDAAEALGELAVQAFEGKR